MLQSAALRFNKNVGQPAWCNRIAKKARTLVRFNQTRMTPSRAKKSRITEEVYYVLLSILPGIFLIEVNNLPKTRQFENDHAAEIMQTLTLSYSCHLHTHCPHLPNIP